LKASSGAGGLGSSFGHGSLISNPHDCQNHYRAVAHTLKPKMGFTQYSKQFFARRQKMAKLEIKQFFQSAMAGEVDYSPTKALINKFLLIPELDEGAHASTNFQSNPGQAS
jgi:hypothetical protein